MDPEWVEQQVGKTGLPFVELSWARFLSPFWVLAGHQSELGEARREGRQQARGTKGTRVMAALPSEGRYAETNGWGAAPHGSLNRAPMVGALTPAD